MSEQIQPLGYDVEREQLFYQTATDKLPIDLKPPEDVNKAAFNDAVLEGYEDLRDRKYTKGSIRYRALLARHTLAISFLQGASEDELEAAKREIRYVGKETVSEVALGVASKGAENIKTQLQQKVDVVVDETPQIEIKNFEGLSNLIRRLYQEERLSEGKAKALLLVIGREEVVADPELKYRIATATVDDLRRRLLRATMHQPHFREKIIDETFAKGAFILKNMIDKPAARLNRRMPIENKDVDDDWLEKYQYDIDAHVGYVLNKLY